MRICVPRRKADIYFGIDTEGIRTYLARVHGLNRNYQKARDHMKEKRKRNSVTVESCGAASCKHPLRTIPDLLKSINVPLWGRQASIENEIRVGWGSTQRTGRKRPSRSEWGDEARFREQGQNDILTELSETRRPYERKK
jgi:hypothetical protein